MCVCNSMRHEVTEHDIVPYYIFSQSNKSFVVSNLAFTARFLILGKMHSMRLPYAQEFWLSQFSLALQDSSVSILLVIIGKGLTPSTCVAHGIHSIPYSGIPFSKVSTIKHAKQTEYFREHILNSGNRRYQYPIMIISTGY